MENHNLQWILPLKIVFFHSYVSHYQRASLYIDHVHAPAQRRREVRIIEGIHLWSAEVGPEPGDVIVAVVLQMQTEILGIYGT